MSETTVVVPLDEGDNRNAMLRMVLGMYVGEACRICGVTFDTIESLNDAVSAGPYEAGQSRVIHRACWERTRPQ